MAEEKGILGKIIEVGTTPIDVLLSGFIKSLQSLIVSFFDSLLSNVDEITFRAADTVTKWMSTTEKDQWGAMLEIFVRAGLLDKETAKELLKWKDLPTPIDQFMFLKTLFSLSSSYMDQTLYGASAELRRAILSKYTPERPGANEMVAAAFIAPEKTNEIRQKLRELGLDDNDIDLMFLARYRLYDENTIRSLWLRGVLSEDEMFMRMREIGYTDTRTKEIIQGWSIIPGPQDLFHLVAKEAFEPDMIKRMGYDDEFPEEQVQWLEKQGLSREWALKYWYAHWETPSIQMGFEMLHRGIIDRDELDMLFRTIEIPPFWREKLTAMTFTPFTRVDARRMHDMGVLSDQELVQAYKDIGYDDEKALKMAEFTVKYNQQNDKDITKSEILTGYKKKAFSRQDAIDLLMDLDYSDAQAEYLILLEDYKEAETLQDDLIDTIKERYQGNLIDAFEARNRLNKLNLPAIQVDTLMDKWEVKKAVDVKLPSKTDLDKFLVAGIINEDTYRQEMTKLGYNFKYTEWYEQLSKGKGGKK